MKQTLLGKTLTELQQVALSVGLQKFAGKQLAEWLYVRRASSNDLMKQTVDLALLSNNMLKGKELHDFIQRSLEMLKK